MDRKNFICAKKNQRCMTKNRRSLITCSFGTKSERLAKLAVTIVIFACYSSNIIFGRRQFVNGVSASIIVVTIGLWHYLNFSPIVCVIFDDSIDAIIGIFFFVLQLEVGHGADGFGNPFHVEVVFLLTHWIRFEVHWCCLACKMLI